MAAATTRLCRSHLGKSSFFGTRPSPGTLPVLHLRKHAYTTHQSSSGLEQSGRDYFYDIDHHGQLFLSNTKIRNFTSCYKDPAFLDIFYTRLKPVEQVMQDQHKVEEIAQDGFRYISLCAGERNFVRCQDTPIVFRELVKRDDHWEVTYAGSLRRDFLPDKLKVDERGYLYHPSPVREPRRRRRKASGESGEQSQEIVENQYGKYSLLRSELVVSHFAKSLELSEDGNNSFEWLGQRTKIGSLSEGDAFQGVELPV